MTYDNTQTKPSPSFANYEDLARAVKPIVISPPFGSWLRRAPHTRGATMVLGTYTLAPIPGRLGQLLSTVRPTRLGWTNSVGLRNAGIGSVTETKCRNAILSLYADTQADWMELIAIAFQLGPAAIELNISCPNLSGRQKLWGNEWGRQVFRVAVESGYPILVKLPPKGWEPIVNLSCVPAGVKGYHACNTLPTRRGALSGKTLKGFSLDAVRGIRNLVPDAFIIGGGGIDSITDINHYYDAGADSFSISSALFNPIRHLTLPRLIRYASNLIG